MKKILTQVIIILCLMAGNNLMAQTLIIKENAVKVKSIRNKIPDGKSLIVIESKLNLVFESSMEYLDNVKKENDLYFLFITQRACLITIKQPELNIMTNIPFGQLSDNSFPTLKTGETRYFIVSTVDKLIFFDNTEREKETGASDNQMLYEKEALLIVTTDPKDMKLEFKSSVNITEVKNQNNRHLIFIKPVDQTIVLKEQKNGATTEINISGIKVKDVKYYFVSLPDYLRDKDEDFDPSISVGNYSIESNPPGAKIQMAGRPDFNNFNYHTPYTIKGYKAGTEIITLTLDRYETVTDTILISNSRGRKAKYNLTPTFGFIKLNIEPALPNFKVLMDGSELTNIENGKNYECPKGIHSFEVNAPHYYPEIRKINLLAGKTSEINVTLKPKMGLLTIEPGENAFNAEVIANGKSIGTLPIQNYQIQEGDYLINLLKTGFVSEENNYNVIIKENQKTNIKDVKMINVVEIKIKTEPVNDAKIYIDGKLVGNSPISTKLAVGDHQLVIQKKNFKDYTANIDLKTGLREFSFTLTPDFNLNIFSKPNDAMVYLDGVLQGNTPIQLSTNPGKHKILLEKDGCVERSKTFVTNDIPQKANIVLKKSLLFGVGYQTGSSGITDGLEAFLISNKGYFSATLSGIEPLTSIPFDYTASGMSAQIGYRSAYPFELIFHGGIGLRSFEHTNNTSYSIYNNETAADNDALDYYSPVVGISKLFHITRSFGFYLNLDYWPLTENKKGIFLFSGGLFL